MQDFAGVFLKKRMAVIYTKLLDVKPSKSAYKYSSSTERYSIIENDPAITASHNKISVSFTHSIQISLNIEHKLIKPVLL